ncbi:MAG: hypothetical protein ACP5VN_10110 [Acidobacteriota bacterium]
MRRPLLFGTAFLVLSAVLALWAAAQDLGEQSPTPPRKPGQPINESAAALTALHRSDSPRYDADCTRSECHAGILSRKTLREGIPDAHVLVAQMGLNPRHCAFCHTTVVIEYGQSGARGNGGSLGKNVATITSCYPCHSAAGPGKQLYGPKKKR